MGGGPQVVKDNQNFQKVIEQIEKLDFGVFAPFESHMFPPYKISKLITSKACNILNSYGFDHRRMEIGGRGGGGETEQVLNILRLLWDNRSYFGIILMLFKIFSKIVKQIYFLFIPKYKDVDPQLDVYMAINIDCEFSQKFDYRLTEHIKDKLILMKIMIDLLCKVLSTEYPLFKFNQVIKLDIYSRNIHITYKIPSTQITMFNKFRLIRLIENVRIDREQSSSYFINRIFIRRRDLLRNKGKETKDYYLFLSSKLLKDYL